MRLAPPDKFLKERTVEEFPEEATNRDLFNHLLEQKKVIELHNEDKAILRIWKTSILEDEIPKLEEEE